MRKIKVAQVITRLDWGGSPDIVRIICQGLQNEFDITLIVGVSKHLTSKTEDFLKGFKHRVIIIPQLRREINPFYDFLAFLKLYFLFRKKRFDIIHTHTAKAGALARLAGALAGTKIIIHTPHGHNFYGYFGFFMSKIIILIEKFLAYFTSALTVLTSLEKRDFLHYKIINPKRIFLIPPALEINDYNMKESELEKLREEFGLKEVDNVVGFIGRLEPIKGVDYFIESAKMILKETTNVKFILIGEGSLRKKLEEEIIKNLEFKEKIIFTGWRDDVWRLLYLFDILVLPSLNEAVGLVLLEAQARAIPVVATKVGGIPEVVLDGKTGVLVPPKDTESLVRAIKLLIKDKTLREIMGKEGYNFVKDKFLPELMLGKFKCLYEKLLKNAN